MGMPTATVKMTNAEGETVVLASVGKGPVDASYQAVDAVVKMPNTLVEYSVHSVTEGIDALGEVTVRIATPDGKKSFGGYGAHSDIVVASVKAYLAALNRMIAVIGQGSHQPEGEVATVGLTTTNS
jgi:2-isopropylmalate synthase